MMNRPTIRSGLPVSLALELESFIGNLLSAGNGRTTRLRFEKLFGRSRRYVTFRGTRLHSSGAVPCVIKVLRPSILSAWPDSLALLTGEQSRVLGAVGSHIPTPLEVVRLLDAGMFVPDALGSSLREVHKIEQPLPWFALEFVDGGNFGNSLFDRVRGQLEHLGVAIDPIVFAAVVRDVTSGLEWIHAQGISHRGLHPRNILLTGAGTETRVSISDVLLSRPVGLPHSVGIELAPNDPMGKLAVYEGDVDGPIGDIHAFAASLAYAVCGVPPGANHHGKDESLIHPAFLEMPNELRELFSLFDDGLNGKYGDVRAFGNQVSRVLDQIVVQTRENFPRLPRPSIAPASTAKTWVWSERHRPPEPTWIDKASGSEGHFLALCQDRAMYFDGMSLRPAPLPTLPHVVARTGRRAWCVISNEYLGRLDPSTRTQRKLQDAGNIVALAGLGDRLLLGRNNPPAVTWLEGNRVVYASAISGCGQLDYVHVFDLNSFLLTGLTDRGEPYLAILTCELGNGKHDLEPEYFGIRPLRAPGHRAQLATPSGRWAPFFGVGASQNDGDVSLLAPFGRVVRVTRAIRGVGANRSDVGRSLVSVEQVPTTQELVAVAHSPEGNAFVADQNTLFERTEQGWIRRFSEDSLSAPIVAIDAQQRSVILLLADATVIEGRPLGG